MMSNDVSIPGKNESSKFYLVLFSSITSLMLSWRERKIKNVEAVVEPTLNQPELIESDTLKLQLLHLSRLIIF